MKRRVLSLLLAMVLVLSIAPVAFAYAPNSGGDGAQADPAIIPDEYAGLSFVVPAGGVYNVKTTTKIEGAVFMFEWGDGYSITDGNGTPIAGNAVNNAYNLYSCAVPGQGAGGSVYAVHNTNSFAMQCSVRLDHIQGHMDEPYVLTNEQAYGQAFTVDIPEGMTKYHILWTPKQDGTVTFEITGSDALSYYFTDDFSSETKNENGEAQAGEFIGIVIENPTGAAFEDLALTVQFKTDFEGPLDGEGAASVVCKVVPTETPNVEGTHYSSVEQALLAAQAGQSVVMLANSFENDNSVLIIKPGVILDLQNWTLVADYFVGLNGGTLTGQVYSKTKVYAKLVVEKNKFVMGETAHYVGLDDNGKPYYRIPLWYGTDDAYVISNASIYVDKYYNRHVSYDNGIASMTFFANFGSGVKADILNDGPSDNQVSIFVRAYWDDEKSNSRVNQDFLFDDDFYEKFFADNKAPYATINCAGKKNVVLEAMIVTDSGVVISTGKWDPVTEKEITE